MKNICFLIGNLNNAGGTERVATLVANELSKDTSYRVFTLNISGGDKPFFSLESAIHNATLYQTTPSFKKEFLRTVAKIRSFIKVNDIDVLIDVDSILCVFTVPALLGLTVKHICWEHFTFKTNLGVRQRTWGRQLAAKYCDYVVTLTKRDKKLWQAGIRNIKANIIYVPNPTPYEQIIHRPTKDNKVILAVGRLSYEKGFDLLLQSWKKVVSANTAWTLRIVGSGRDEHQLKHLAKQLNISDNIEFIPSNKNMADYYQAASIFCLSSRFEGFGMVILEAMSFSLPVVSFDCEVGPRELIQNGINGYLAVPNDVDDLADKLIKMIEVNDEEYAKMSQQSLEIAQQFSVEQIASQWKAIL